ncbi:hypothetical protein ACFS4T_23020 [Pseudomonas lini]
MLGKVMPVEVARQCTVMVGEQAVFDQRFNFFRKKGTGARAGAGLLPLL